MHETRSASAWRDWLKLRRLLPLLTIAFAVGVGVLSFFDLIAQVPDEVIVTLLALIAVDALVERMSLLEKISARVEKWPEEEVLRDRSKLNRMEELAAGATEIWAAGISLVSIIRPYDNFYLQKLRDGCNLRFLLLDPNSKAAEVWNKKQQTPTAKKDIKLSLQSLDNLIKHRNLKGKCEVRLAQAFLPFSLVIVNGQKDYGKMTVEMLAYKKNLHDRPHLQLTKRDHEKWFRFFSDQFEILWQDSSERKKLHREFA
ncbi:hypothetical protein DCC62_17710 [candidate division KSB1 bacterium]|nr:MAG: hypothetical protein DCC62_17710 [candidate division KSB1 bacterium]